MTDKILDLTLDYLDENIDFSDCYQLIQMEIYRYEFENEQFLFKETFSISNLAQKVLLLFKKLINFISKAISAAINFLKSQKIKFSNNTNKIFKNIEIDLGKIANNVITESKKDEENRTPYNNEKIYERIKEFIYRNENIYDLIVYKDYVNLSAIEDSIFRINQILCEKDIENDEKSLDRLKNEPYSFIKNFFNGCTYQINNIDLDSINKLIKNWNMDVVFNGTQQLSFGKRMDLDTFQKKYSIKIIHNNSNLLEKLTKEYDNIRKISETYQRSVHNDINYGYDLKIHLEKLLYAANSLDKISMIINVFLSQIKFVIGRQQRLNQTLAELDLHYGTASI